MRQILALSQIRAVYNEAFSAQRRLNHLSGLIANFSAEFRNPRLDVSALAAGIKPDPEVQQLAA